MDEPKLDRRRLDVLRAIVEDYVATQEPVGSKALVERHNLGVSPATIRNDMALLEEEGYIHQPHTSAGRVPTDKGYRLFVDRLTNVKPLTTAERRAIHSFLDEALDLDDVVSRTVRLLAQLTRQVAVVQYPSLTRSAVRHVELVGLAPTRIMLVLITDTGRVEQRVVEVVPLEESALGELRARLNAEIVGRRLSEVPGLLEDFARRRPAGEAPPAGAAPSAVDALCAVLLEMIVEQREERIVFGGTANLARFGQDFPDTIHPVLEALEEQVVLLKLLGEATAPSLLTVRIGRENELDQLTSTSVVTSGYGRGDDTLAQLGVLGPTRMDYPGTMGAVSAVARYVGRILEQA
ncbi:heat-inducible transcriptional repressor HrcA [Actinospica sp. MGRD01-02]|uniref:Heat-inducible transcription repressor HrcA n=1 Tax=Actinospica acidithermotolerans TaxID=2828514 RepID=A0A941EEL1_9ACTN|nr:heat-inducible transcriptional repressor HrcA [Actinospica acidithermotolerans]MBR7830056.1 heat-inducible transcriptional repressor HrcA [Actinospica acidithermotolerans]